MVLCRPMAQPNHRTTRRLFRTTRTFRSLRKRRLLSKLPVALDGRISLATAFLVTFCIGVAAAVVWQSSGQVVSVPQAAPAAAALSPTLEQQLEAMSSGLAAVQQSIDELSSGLGQMRRDIGNLQTTEQAVFDKISEPWPAAAPLPRSTSRPPSRRPRRADRSDGPALHTSPGPRQHASRRQLQPMAGQSGQSFVRPLAHRGAGRSA
jgi:hypothetical protein